MLSRKSYGLIRAVIFVLSVFLPIYALAAPIHYTVNFYTITLNGQFSDQPYVFLQNHQQIYIEESTLKSLHMTIPHHVRPIVYDDKNFYLLQQFTHLKYSINTSKGTINITSTANAFDSNDYNLEKSNFVTPTPITHPGMFMNYDLFTERSNVNDDQLSALAENGLFTNYGVGINDLVVRNNVGNQTLYNTNVINTNHNTGNNHFQVIRLSTNWTRDFPATMHQLVIGDSITDPGLWGDSLSFAGIQYSSDFATQPSYTTFPLPSARGLAVVPSAVNVYVNNNLQQQQQVASGPFIFNNLPVVTGEGNVQLVVQNALGQQQVFNVPYYSSQLLLKPGLQQFSYDAGLLRRDYGIENFNYATAMASGSDNIGITDNLTTQVHAEVSQPVQDAGVSANYLIGHFGVLTVSGAMSHADSVNTGELAMVQFSRQTRFFNFGFSSQYTTNRFRLLSSVDGFVPVKWQNQVFTGFNFKDHGSLGLSFTQQELRSSYSFNNINTTDNFTIYNTVIPAANTPTDNKFVSVNYSNVFLHRVSYSLSGVTNVGGQKNQAVFLILTLPFGADSSATSQSNWQSQSEGQQLLGLQKNLPTGTGYGYNLNASVAQESSAKYASGVGYYQNNIGTYNVGIAEQGNQTSYQAEAAGGIVWLDGYLGLTRTINNSFAVIKTPGLKDVPIYWENNLVGDTNEHGYAFVPNLLPYNQNKISIDPAKLPWDAQISSPDDYVIPYYRSGVVVRFPIKIIRPGSLTIELPDGASLPLKAEVINTVTHEQYAVGYNGQVYLDNVLPMNILKVNYAGKSCVVTVPEKIFAKQPIESLGNFICHLN